MRIDVPPAAQTLVFTLKKLISAFIYPLPLILIGALVVLALTWRKPRAMRTYLALLLISAWLVSTEPVAYWAAHPLEAPYPPVKTFAMAAPIENIVVLSSASHEHPDRHIFDELDEHSMRRVMEGVRLAKALPRATLVMSGGRPVDQTASTAKMMGRFAESLGIDPARIQLEESSRDTADQADLLAERVGAQPFLLVTSAFHMRRSMALFQHVGTEPIAAPTDYLTGEPRRWELRHWLPSREGVHVMTRAAHEWIGLLWAEMAGLI